MIVSQASRGDARGASVAARSLRIAAWHSMGNDVVEQFEELLRRGERPDPRAYSSGQGDGCDLLLLSALVKSELRVRYERGEAPDAREYLALYPELQNDRERVVSLIYEEYCLREENGLGPSAESFCDRYAPWRDSIASQLRYHHMLSQVIPPRAAPRYPHVGELFAAKFRLRSILGEGGAGRVYLAEQPDLGDRPVALKLSPGQSKEPSIQGRLDHEHIVPVWSVVDDATTGLRGLCMPFRPGRPLDQVIRRVDPAIRRPRSAKVLWDAIQPGCGTGTPAAKPSAAGPQATDTAGWQGFPQRESYARGAAWLVAKVARALAHAHERGIMHRDVKPANILVTVREGPQLLDFNLAHDPNAAEQAEAALRGGTLPYMAPEQLLAFLDPSRWSEVSEAADLYSLGLVLKEMLTGQRPQAPDPNLPLPRAINQLLDDRRSRQATLSAVDPTIPRALDAIVGKCLAYDAADRYESTAELAEDLERFVSRQPLRHAVNPSRRETVGNWFHRQRFSFLAGGVLIGLLLAFSLFRTPRDARLLERLALDQAQSASDLAEDGLLTEANEKLRQSRKNAREALALNPELPTPYLVLGHVARMLDQNPDDSLAYYDRAIELNDTQRRMPKDYLADLLKNRAQMAYLIGERLRKPPGDVAALYRARPFYEKALENAIKAELLLPESDPPWRISLLYVLARARCGLGDVAAAHEDYDHAKELYAEARRAAAAARDLAKGKLARFRKDLDTTIVLLDARLKTVEPLIP